MLASILLSVICLFMEMVGMRCTTFMAEEPEQKDKVALAGGVIFVIAGQSEDGGDVETFGGNNNSSVCLPRSPRSGGNVLVRPQDRSGFLQPVYTHQLQVGPSPDSSRGLLHKKSRHLFAMTPPLQV